MVMSLLQIDIIITPDITEIARLQPRPLQMLCACVRACVCVCVYVCVWERTAFELKLNWIPLN